MTFAAAWTELENQGATSSSGRLRRRVEGQGVADIYLELLLPNRDRAVALVVSRDLVASADDLPQARGVEHILAPEDADRIRLLLRLTDPAAADIFGVLAEDLAAQTATAPDEEAALHAWVGRVSRWKRLLQNSADGLSGERQRGLFAELLVLRDDLAPRRGPLEAVAAWEGPTGAAHDFQMGGGSLEVKSCAANQPQIVTISSERQLDDTGTASLHLIHVSLDVHRPGKESLPEMVESVRELAAAGGALADLEERLFDYGYLDAHVSRYQRTGYEVRERRAFRVGDGFPRLVESGLPEGVGSVRYRLAVAACVSFEVDLESALAVAAS